MTLVNGKPPAPAQVAAAAVAGFAPRPTNTLKPLSAWQCSRNFFKDFTNGEFMVSTVG
jgi:hypothetical protein